MSKTPENKWKKKDEIIWGNVVKKMESLGWSWAHLAREARTRPQTINGIKSKARGIGGNLLKRIADALGVSVAELMSENLFLQKVKLVMESNSEYSTALRSNIEAFDKAVKEKNSALKEKQNFKSQITEIRKEIDYLKNINRSDVDTNDNDGG
jgi:transcriptional regulator with XRE-family HTH domain